MTTQEYVTAGPIFPYVEWDRLKMFVDGVSDSEVNDIARVFLKNVWKIKVLNKMPYSLVADGVGSLESLVAYTVCALEAPERPGNLEVNSKRARERLKERFGSEKGRLELAGKIDEGIAVAMQNDDVKSAMAVIRQVTVPLAWTAFEAACRDLWVCIVNRSSSATAQNLFRVLDAEADDGLGRKLIEIGVLARHGFDLRGRVGSALVTKFQFSSVEGLRRAFSAISEKNNRLEDVFGSPDLFLLETVRHLIVHRAGIVDEKFQRLTNWNGELGREIEISIEQLTAMLDSAIRCATQLITRIDSY